MNKKVLVVGSDSPHVVRFVNLIDDYFSETIYVGEDNLKSDLTSKQYQLSFSSMNPFEIWKNQKRLKKIIADEKPDIVHIQQVNRMAFMTARLLRKQRIKYAVTAWGSDVLIIPKKNALYKKITQYVLNHATHITADSLDMIQAIRALSENKNVALIFFGIEPIESGVKEKIIFSNRSLNELYNISGVIDEFFEFQKLNPDWKLVIAGKGELESDLKKKSENLGINSKVEFVGWLSSQQNIEWYKKSAIYISIPFSDGTSVSLLEAMSAGCIPVVSDLPVSYEWIENKRTGIIKQSGINAFEEALKLDAKIVAQHNADLIEKKATGKIASEKFIQIYKEMEK
jgi:glycosyltransferase involved in cell wall biosynthesis